MPSLKTLLRLATPVLLHRFVTPSVATDISLYKDAECRVSLDNINGPNGYSDGACTRFRERVTTNYSSIQVVNVDPGCSVTLYSLYVGDSCAAEAAELAKIAHCYNTSWVYYSIDECIPPDQLPSSWASPTPSTPSGSNKSLTGAIAGGVVGGVVGVAVIIGALVFYLRRRRRLARERQAQQTSELPPGEKPLVTKADEKVGMETDIKHELTSDTMPSEMPDRQSPVEMPDQNPPVEMEASPRSPSTAKGTW